MIFFVSCTFDEINNPPKYYIEKINFKLSLLFIISRLPAIIDFYIDVHKKHKPLNLRGLICVSLELTSWISMKIESSSLFFKYGQ